jgi:uncharacterized Zn finger protein (UPF0148 family)
MPSAIIFDDDSGDVYCDSPCDALLIERKDGSMICSYCGKEYLPQSVKNHKRHLGPIESPYDDSDVPLVSLSDYANPQRKKPSVFDKEDKLFEASKSGRYFTEHEDYFP